LIPGSLIAEMCPFRKLSGMAFILFEKWKCGKVHKNFIFLKNKRRLNSV